LYTVEIKHEDVTIEIAIKVQDRPGDPIVVVEPLSESVRLTPSVIPVAYRAIADAVEKIIKNHKQ
jgi:ACT domain-containing protein